MRRTSVDGTARRGAARGLRRRGGLVAAGAAALLVAQCDASGGRDAGSGDAAPVDAGDWLAPPPRADGFQLGIELQAEPREELWKCVVTTMPNTRLSAVNRVVSRQTGGVHHMNVMVLSLTGIDVPDGEHDCRGLYERYPAMMENGIYLYASQLADQEVQLPEGTAAVLPPRLLVMYELHYLNLTDQRVPVRSTINAYTIPTENVRNSIWGFTVRDVNINVPPRSEHTEWSRCVMNEDVDVIFLSTHTHELSTRTTISSFDGRTVGPVLYESNDWHAPPLQQFPTPLRVRAGEGFEYRCEYRNTTNNMVHWGFNASDEMCQMALVFTPNSQTARCDTVETSDGVLPEPTGGGGDGGVLDGGAPEGGADAAALDGG